MRTVRIKATKNHNPYFSPSSRFDKSGQLVDSNGQVVYRFVDESEDHKFSQLYKDYPLRIQRADGSKMATIEWKGEDTEKTSVKWAHTGIKQKIKSELMDDKFRFQLQDGSRYQWDGVPGHSLNLFDYRTPQPYSLTPATAAVFTPRKNKTDATVEVLLPACSVPSLLDYLVVTTIWFEYSVYTARKKKENEEFTEDLTEQVLDAQSN